MEELLYTLTIKEEYAIPILKKLKTSMKSLNGKKKKLYDA